MTGGTEHEGESTRQKPASSCMHANATHHETTQTADRAFTDLRPPTQKCPGSQGAKLLRVSQSPRTPLMQNRLALKEMLREPWRGVWVEEGGGPRGKR